MTEEEARTKWCPQANNTVEEFSRCLASECMWWVWDYQDLDPEFSSQDEGHCGAVK